jgi:serine/threonine protein phosphatase PrpC
VESHRLTQIPRTNNHNNNLYAQNDIFNHLSNQYLNDQNIFNLSDNQIYNNIQNQNINLINQENYIKNQEKSKEIINSKDVDITFNKFDASGWVKNYGILTLPGKDLSGCQKTNQDSFVFKTNVNNIKDFNIFGVLDGHGPEGHFVSKFVSEFIPALLSNHPEIRNLKEPETIYKKLKDNNFKIITKTFIEADNQLKRVSFDATESGCTCVLVIQIGSHIICANTGDSRAIVVHDDRGENNLDYFRDIPLSIDYKPEIPEETNRIILNGGEVRQMKNEFGVGIGPYRVWARDCNYPGLAMSRSIGDLKGKNIGVIPDPGIIEYKLSERTKYIIACSDGVWEFLSNENVKNIGKKFYIDNNPSGFCHELINQSLNLWENNDIVVDDITAVVAFF